MFNGMKRELRRWLEKGIGRRKRWSEREAKGQGREIPATSRLICSSAHLYVSRIYACIYFFSYIRAPASIYIRTYTGVCDSHVLHTS